MVDRMGYGDEGGGVDGEVGVVILRGYTCRMI